MVSPARMPWMVPSSVTVSRAFSTAATFASIFAFSSSWNLRARAERSSPLVDCTTFSTVPRTAAPASGPPITTASTGSPAFEVCVDTLVLRRIGISAPDGSWAALATTAKSRAARLLLVNFGNRAIDVLNFQDETPPLLDARLRGVEAGGNHPVHRGAGGDGLVAEQRIVKLLAKQRDRLEEAFGVHLGGGAAVVAIAVGVFENQGHGADHEAHVGRVGDAEIDHGNTAVLVERRGPHLEEASHQADARAALHDEHARDDDRDQADAYRERGEEAFAHIRDC